MTLFERNGYPGGHSNTVIADWDGTPIAVDTGFIVYNEWTYPNLIALFDHLGVATERSDMSFSVSIGDGALEYEGSPRGLIAQPSNLLRPRYWSMLADTMRFFRAAPRLLTENEADLSLGDWLRRDGYGDAFVSDHLLPMAAAIWSCPVDTMMTFPARTIVRFFANHGLLLLGKRPQWWTVSGGSRRYVARILQDIGTPTLADPAVSIARDGDGVTVRTASAEGRFDEVVLATHGDEALALLEDPSADERRVLSAFRYQGNRAVLHRDPGLMPRRRGAWASWNYLAEPGGDPARRVSLTYWMNRLQNIDRRFPLFVSMNPLRDPAPELTFGTFDYEHPVFDHAAVAAQSELPSIQGPKRTWFCGSYCGYGFHEDGLKSAVAVARALGADIPWRSEVAPANRAGILGGMPAHRPTPVAGPAVAAAGD